MTRLIGLDVGTSSTKGIAVDETGAVLAIAERAYPLSTPRPGWSDRWNCWRAWKRWSRSPSWPACCPRNAAWLSRAGAPRWRGRSDMKLPRRAFLQVLAGAAEAREIGHAAAAWAAKRDPLFVEVARRHLRIPTHLNM